MDGAREGSITQDAAQHLYTFCLSVLPSWPAGKSPLSHHPSLLHKSDLSQKLSGSLCVISPPARMEPKSVPGLQRRLGKGPHGLRLRDHACRSGLCRFRRRGEGTVSREASNSVGLRREFTCTGPLFVTPAIPKISSFPFNI